MTNRTFHYVAYARVEDFLRCGWVVMIPNGPTYHNYYGVPMEWLCDCKMARPQ